MLGIGLVFLSQGVAVAQGALQVTYGSAGVQQITYQGTVLEDFAQHPGDAFHIWHMKLTDLNGNTANCSECGWGESNNGRTWNPATHTWTYSFVWGSISVAFQQVGDTLNINVTEINLQNSGYILDGATIYPLVLNFPQLPSGFVNVAYPQYAFETTGPGVTSADWGTGEVVAVVPDASKPLYSGFVPTGTGYGYTPIISGTAPDGLAVFLPHNDRPVQPGQSDSFTVSLRFAPSGTAASTLGADAYQNWAGTWPSQLNWADRRAIGTAYLASSPTGNINQPGGYPNNPRRYFNDSNADDLDVTTPVGLQKFQAKVLAEAATIVANLGALNAQGNITWDIEGEQYPQDTSYVCSPDQIAQVAPEMESIIRDSASPFFGMKLDDAYFKTITNAGYRVGVCIRPQQFTLNPDGTAQQVYLPDSAIAAQLIRKIQFAHSRWGATLFYIDSTVESNGAVLDAGIFQQVAAAFPDSLIIPEESTPKHYAYTAPFLTFLDHGDLGTNSTIYNYYPRAFSVNLINDVAASTLAANMAALTASVQHGDILMAHADYAQDNNPTIVQIYRAAGQTPQPAPAPIPTPSLTSSPIAITSPAASTTVSGMVLVTAQIGTNLGADGSYLLVDGAEYGSYRALQAPYQYPLDTSALANGEHTLQVWAQDSANEGQLSQSVTITVANVAANISVPPATTTSGPAETTSAGSTTANAETGLVVITAPGSGAAVSGTISVTAQMNAALDAAGSYLMVDGVEFGRVRVTSSPYLYPLDTTLLGDGTHSLQIWAHDTGNSVDLSQIVSITVGNGGAAAAATGGTADRTLDQTQAAPTAVTSYPITIAYPMNGQAVSGAIVVSAVIAQPLDAAGSHLIMDGASVPSTQVSSAPYLYPLDMASVTPGSHILQVWAHDINNDTLLSNPVTITTTR